MTLEISDIVRVTDRLQPIGALRRELGITLLVTTDDTVLAGSGSGRLRSYGNLDALIADFGSSGSVVNSATRYFGQRIFPRNLLVGRWRNADVATFIYGGAPDTAATIEAISDGSFSIGGVNFTATDFDNSAPTYDTIATVLQAKLRTNAGNAFQNASVTYSATNSRFEIQFPNFPDFNGVFAAHTAGTGTDVSSLLGLTADDGAVQLVGGAQETIAQALTALNELNDSFYFGILDSAFNGTQTMLDASAWFGAAQRKEFIAESNEDDVTDTNDAATFAARLSALQAPRTLLLWSGTSDQKAASVAAFLSAIDFTQPRGIRTLKFKPLPGTTPDNITQAQKTELDRKRINHYSPYGGINMVAEGWLGSGDFVEVRFWLDWFVEAIQVAVFNHLYSNEVPMTRAGLTTIRNVVAGVCRQGLSNGGLAPGRVNAAMEGEIKQVTGRPFDGNLNNGYLIYVPDIEATNRESRRSPGIRIWGRGGSAVHFANISIDFQGS